MLSRLNLRHRILHFMHRQAQSTSDVLFSSWNIMVNTSRVLSTIGFIKAVLLQSGIAIILSSFITSCTPYIVYPENQNSSVAPYSASGLGWVEASPTNRLTVTANWKPSSSPNLTQQTVQFFQDGSCFVPFGQPLNLQPFALTQALTGINGGTYAYTVASQDTAGGLSISPCSSSISIITTPPTNAMSLGWTQNSPVNAVSATASWTKSNSGVLSNQKIQFFSDASCTAVFGSLIDLASASAQSYTFSAANGTYTYKIISIDTAGNSNTSSCATPIVIDDLTNASLSSFTTFPASIPADVRRLLTPHFHINKSW